MKMPDIDWPPTIEPVFDKSADETAGRLAGAVAERLEAALQVRERASLAVSGGSTPKPFFEKLRKKSIDWARVDITLADERWVPTDSKDSNERLLRETLLQGSAAEARFIGLKQGHDTANAGQPLAEEALATITWPLDVVILGMGNDGHTASLFPDAPEIDNALEESLADRCMALHPVSQSQPRLSLTRSALAGAGWLALHLRGQDKMETLEKAIVDMNAVREMPIRAFLSVGVSLFWSP